MKTLDLNQMENLQGGDVSCGLALGGYAATIIIGALAGPIGWAFIASVAVASVGVVDGCIAN